MTDDLRRLEAKIDDVLALLRDLAGGIASEPRQSCQSCGGYEPDGHYESCEVARARSRRRAAGGAA